MDNRIQVCEKIAEDAKNDATQFDGKPFNGRTADLIKSILEDQSKPQPNAK